MADVLTTVGKQWIVDVLDGTVAVTADFIGWGTGAGTAAVGDTDLFTPATEARVSATRTQPAADTIRWVAQITADGTKTITNAGVFDGAGTGSPPSGGTPLIAHGDFTGVALVAGDKIEFTANLQIT